MVSMFANHFINWTLQLKNSGHELYWLDVYDSNTYFEDLEFVNQITGWRNRFNFPGRYVIKKKHPTFYKLIQKVNQRNLNKKVNQEIKRIKPDIVHSFVMQSGTLPILKTMQENPHVKWVFSAWGNDLFFRKQNFSDLSGIKKTLPHLDYMFADCNRDMELAYKLGFEGYYLGTFPGGGGYNINFYNKFLFPKNQRNVIVIKGYQSKLGRCIQVLKALSRIKTLLNVYEIQIFGGNEEVENYLITSGLSEWINLKFHKIIPHKQVMELMGKAKIYIGNNISDGTPNTLLEAFVMETFPIQSNPGGATEEWISHGKNGLLIENPEDINEIKNLILRALQEKNLVDKGIEYNTLYIKPRLERELIKNEVLSKYRFIENNL